jgi:hypothetical protein
LELANYPMSAGQISALYNSTAFTRAALSTRGAPKSNFLSVYQYDALIPSIVVRDGAKAIDFYRDVFGASELMRMTYPETHPRSAEYAGRAKKQFLISSLRRKP